MIYEKKFPFLAAFYAGFFKNRNSTGINLDDITVSSSLAIVDEQIIDVIIPTIGRKKYLYDFLCDLRKQTYLPTNVIIVEQNPLLDSMSELDYLYNELWPFRIKHTFIHQSGACNARNVALSQVESKWVFFADDDIRIDENFIVNVFRKINNWCVKAVSINCSHEGEIEQFTKAFQWTSFGSGCSFVLNKSIKNCKFSKGFEFGYGEDSDFGMQVRNQGSDILYLPEPKIFHLRAPIGGFRTKPNLLWVNEKIQPKPSPTVMLYKILNNTEQERRGYKTILFFKYYKHQERKNPVGYFFHFNKQWNQSKFWADQLKNTI
jgi:glycosyltransferase involved in cell wall biosynthesis